MNICFVLPDISRQPQGGYKIAFEYANRMVEKGHKVTIVFINKNALKAHRLFQRIEKIRQFLSTIVTHYEPRWFSINKSITKVSGYEKSKIKGISDETNVVVATSVDTVPFVEKHFAGVRTAYLIQDFETWIASEEEVRNSYRKGFINIVISDWLKKIVDSETKNAAVLIKNPIDLESYCVRILPQKRKKHSIALLYHEKEFKGVKYALEALIRLKEIYNDLQVEMFGIFDLPEDIPHWIHYTKGATQEQTIEIYNKCQVFLCASIAEGYGLTGLEAMACGAVLVSTDYQGVYEYAEDGVNALLSPVKNVNGLVENVCKVFDNEKLRNEIISNASNSVKHYSWEKAAQRFEETILGESNV